MKRCIVLEAQRKLFSCLILFLSSLWLTACGAVPIAQEKMTVASPPLATAGATARATARLAPTQTATGAVTPPATKTPTKPPTPTPTPTATPAASEKVVSAVGPFLRSAPIPPALLGPVTEMHAAPDGSLWIVTAQGYTVLREGHWHAWPVGRAQSLIGVEDTGRMWFFIEKDGSKIYFSEGGPEYTLADTGWVTVPRTALLKGRGVLTDPLGQVWLYTDQDVRRFDGERWTIFTLEEMSMTPLADREFDTWFTLELIGDPGQIWVGECHWIGPGPSGGGGARWFDGRTWRGADSPVASGCVTTIREDNLGRVWVGVDIDLWRYDPVTSEWKHFPPPEPPKNYRRLGYLTDIALDPAGEPWPLFALCSGASCVGGEVRYQWHDGAWTQIGEVSEDRQFLLFDSAGTPWVFENWRAYHIEDDGAVEIEAAELYVVAAAADASGQIWVVGTPPGGETAVWAVDARAEALAVCPPGNDENFVISSAVEGATLIEMFEPQILAYLNSRGDAQGLQAALDQLNLNGWTARSFVTTADVTGDVIAEEIVDLLFYVEGQFADGALFVFRCQAGEYVGGEVTPIGEQLFAGQGPEPVVRTIQDMNGNGMPDILISYVTVIGTHANYTREFRILEWDGSQFVDLIQSNGSRPHAAKVLNGDGVIRDTDGDGLLELELTHGVGRGPDANALDRPHTDVWAWNGEAFTLNPEMIEFTVSPLKVHPSPEPPSDAQALKLMYPDEDASTYNVILSAPFRQEGYDKHLVLTDNTLVNHCPACPVYVDAALFVQHNDVWRLEDLHQVDAEFYTTLDNSPRAMVIPFGSEKDGIVFGSGYQGQGYLISTDTYVTDVNGRFRQVLSLTTFESNRLSDACFEQQLCYEYRATVDFIRGHNPIYDDIRVTTSGTKLVDDQLVEFTEVATYTFSGETYTLAPSPTEPPPTATPSVGLLEVDIVYSGTWYRETFGYTRRAKNIKHFVLVMPESEVPRATAAEIFTSIRFPTSPDVLLMREGRKEFSWALEYLYEVPEGHFHGQFEPGTYYVAAAFIAAPLSKEEAGHSDDVILYAGITGGGASTDYQQMVIRPGENTIGFSLTDGHGWACPWLYVYNGHDFERRTEILRNVRGKQNEQTEVSYIGPLEIVDGSITFAVAEEREETSFIDEFYIMANGMKVCAEADPHVAAKVAEKDQDYLIITAGESYEFRFKLPASFAAAKQAAVSVVVSGFYVPLK